MKLYLGAHNIHKSIIYNDFSITSQVWKNNTLKLVHIQFINNEGSIIIHFNNISSTMYPSIFHHFSSISATIFMFQLALGILWSYIVYSRGCHTTSIICEWILWERFLWIHAWVAKSLHFVISRNVWKCMTFLPTSIGVLTPP
jgi:hypothetical protein